jgi:flagellar biosynthetic protein FlhB
MTEDDAERPHEPTQKRLQDAREKGDLPRSPDLLAVAAYGGLLLAVLMGARPLLQTAEGGAALLSQADRMAGTALAAGQPFALGLAGSMLLPLWPFFALPALAVMALLVGLRGVVFSPEKLVPTLSRINPIANAKQKFGPEGVVEFAKSLIKLILTGAVLACLAQSKGESILAAMTGDPDGVMLEMAALTVLFLALIFLLQLGLGMFDALWQWHRFRLRNRMSDKDMRDESKESEGDPHLRAYRRQRGQEIALNRMLADLPGADVVIVNPTHYAVALKWDRALRVPPICIAKGTDEAALRIRQAAAQHGIPVRHDPPTARALHASVKIGEPIRPDHYRAVAAAIRFAEALRRKAKTS